MSSIQIALASREERGECLAIRRRVFIEGQGVPESLEMDGRDDECVHLLARDGEGAIGTARLRTVDGAAKAERVAVLDSHRGRGVGRLLMGVLENEARERGLAPVVLNAQLDVVPFYEKLGYGVRGEVFEEAGIPHQPMQKPSPEPGSEAR